MMAAGLRLASAVSTKVREYWSFSDETETGTGLRPRSLSATHSASIGATPIQDAGRSGYGTLDLSLTQRITRFASLKYELYNALGEKPKWLVGDKLQWATEVDNYGRTAFIHLILR